MNFEGDNYGQVARIIINVHEAATEAQKQKSFFDATKISCCKDAREFYLLVLEDGQFSVSDLRHAIQQGSIRWDFGATQPTIVMPWTEPVFAAILFGAMGMYAMLAVLAILMRWDNVADQATAHACLFAVFCVSTMVVAQRYILLPRRIAIRVRDWMSQK